MERIVIPESLKKITISFPPPPHAGKTALTLEGIGKHYGDKQVLFGLDLNIDAGERLVVVGKNGAGKSTLLRIIAAVDSNYQGTVSYGSGIDAGFFSQERTEELNSSDSILAHIEESAPTALIPKVRDMLGAFLFRGDDVYKSLHVLSGGEKSRIALLGLLLRPHNLLILDEPTNHLDIHSKDVLLEALSKFSGTIIFVSHDRKFMEALSTKTLELSVQDGKPAARLFYGGYGYYLERIEQEEKQSLPQNTAEYSKQTSMQSAKSGLNQREQNKQQEALIRRHLREEKVILDLLEKLENEKAFLEAELAKPEVYSSGEKTKAIKLKLESIAAEIQEKTIQWEVLSMHS